METQITKRNISLNSTVKLLWETYPTEQLTEGRTILYEDLERIIGAKKQSNRFHCVIGRWRNELLKIVGKVLICHINVGYEVGDDHQRLAAASSLQRSGIRKLYKSTEVHDTVKIDKLSEDERVLYTKMRNANASLTQSFRRELEIPKI